MYRQIYSNINDTLVNTINEFDTGTLQLRTIRRKKMKSYTGRKTYSSLQPLENN